MPLRRLALVALAAAAGTLPAGEDTRPRKVDLAIRKGRDWLRKDLEAHFSPKAEPGRPARIAGRGSGQTLLVSLALVHAGLPVTDPLIRKSWEDLRSRRPGDTYETGLALLLCEALISKGKEAKGQDAPDPRGIREWARPVAESLARRGVRGAWSYQHGGYGPGRDGEKGYEMAPSGRIGSDELRKRVAKAQGDLSNTQYAVLGLKAASLCGAAPEGGDALWRAVAQALLDAQAKDGPAVTMRLEGRGEGKEDGAAFAYGRSVKAKARGWAYSYGVGPAVQPYGSMTCAGVGCLAIARSEISDLDAKEREAIDLAIRDGLAWLAQNFRVDRNPYPHFKDAQFGGMWNYYYLYGLERACVLSGVESIGANDWYEKGWIRLLSLQQEDGSWKGGGEESPTVCTAFAVLFLSRATSRRFAERYHIGAPEPQADPEPEPLSPETQAALEEDPPDAVEPLSPPETAR